MPLLRFVKLYNKFDILNHTRYSIVVRYLLLAVRFLKPAVHLRTLVVQHVVQALDGFWFLSVSGDTILISVSS